MRTSIRFFREDPLFAGLLAASCVLCLLVIWIPSYLPLLDHPQHVALIETISHYGDPQKRFEEYYSLRFDLSTYGLYYWPAALAGKVVSAEAASRLMLSLYAVLLPFGMVALLEAQGRSRRLALLSVPFVFNTNFFMGFEAFCLSVAMLPWTLASADRCFSQRTRRREIALALWLNALFLMHALTFLLAIGLVGLRSLQRGRGLVGLLRRQVPVVAGAITFSVWFLRSFLLQPKGQFSQTGMLDYFKSDQLLAKIPEHLLNGFATQDDSKVLVVLALTILFCLFATQSYRAADTSGEPVLVRYRAEIAVLVTFLVYMVTPIQIPGIWYICPRFLLPAALLLVACLRFEPRGLATIVLVPALVLAFAWPARVLGHFLDVSREAGDLDEAVAVVRPGSKVLGLIYYGDTGTMAWNPFLHAGAYAVAEKGGGLGFSFAYSPAVPVQYRDPKQFPHPNEWRPGEFSLSAHGRFYDYLLVRGKRTVHPNPFGRDYLRAGIDYYGDWWSVYHVEPSPGLAQYDFLDHIDEAAVALVGNGVATPCPRSPDGKFKCGERIWEYVGRYEANASGARWNCIWVHPYENAVLRVTFPRVPVSRTIYGLYGLADTAVVQSAPRLAIRVGDAPEAVLGSEGKGVFSLLYVDTAAREGTIQDVTFEISSDNVGSQHACFLAQTVR